MQMQEVWKNLKGIVKNGETYSVSTLGRIRNDETGRILKRHVHKQGYLYVGIGTGTALRVHRLVALAFIPNPDNKPQVNHIDGDKTNACVDNLEWVTPSENIIHAVQTGLQQAPKGENHHAAKLSMEDVIEIKKLLAQGVKSKAIVEKFNVTKMTVSCIKTGRTWSHVEVEGFTPSKYDKDPRRVS